MKLNYESEHYKNDTISLSPCAASNCANEKVPEASVVEYMHANTETLRGIDHMANELYTCLYGAMERTSAPPRTDGPTCFTDELTMQGQMISDIHYTLALICTKLGM